MNTPALQRIVFLLLLALITIAFGWVLMPFFGAVFWAMTLALMFDPIYQRLCVKLRGRSNTAALITLMACLVIVILPMALITSTLITEVTGVTQRIKAGEINFRSYFQQILSALPNWLLDWLDRFGLSNLQGVLDRVSSGLAQGGQMLASNALAIGQNTFDFLVSFVIMMYLLFFLLRDGRDLSKLVRDSVPLEREHTRYLLSKFATVIRATVKGNVLVALAQGALGGLAFWALGIHAAVFWGVVMALLSLLPAIGAALVWAPVAIYLISTGSVWPGIGLVLWGVLAIGLSDNVLRPLLVGKDTKMPDYLVLVSTIGGMSLFGINGFVIGPTIAAMFMAFWALFNRRDDEAMPEDPEG
ncbi:AI-2E family transporter [Ottowia thiooxydans]|uniref:AI-2E family transporter n=1 Tax=Ottowia thiooxydans TaxID=219182 RepID=UPI00049106E9|nr:AI-2E family transporter [Ottowia thiooxydans]